MLRNKPSLIALSALAGAALATALWPTNKARADHAPPSFNMLNAPTDTAANSGGEGASWDIFTSLYSGNPHTDLDFFRLDGDFYVAVGTLAIGPNGGGQTIYRLTKDGQISPSFVSTHASAACVTDPSQATALQHDVEVTPKGDVLFNTDWKGMADTRPAQLLLDATDGPGRCHDQGAVAVAGSQVFDQPQGGLEIVDITDVANPVEIHLTSHIGESHTVNVDPKRSHIAYSVTSDTVTIANRPDEMDTTRSEQMDLDGFELVDLSSCMNFPAGTDLATKRAECRPQVYRYRFNPDWARGTDAHGISGACHELELYPDDKLACASLNSSILLDMSGVFDDNGTPDDYTDDIPRGTPLPCSVRESASKNEENLYATDALVTDCVNGLDGKPLTIGGWLDIGAPSLEGVELIGFVNHTGRGGSGPRPPADDIEVSHEAELSHSGRYLIVTDERGGGIVPPNATCPAPGDNSINEEGNGGIHVYDVNKLFTEYPGNPAVDSPAVLAERADAAYALTPEGNKAVYRATPRMLGATFCTSHVYQQIPGQNRIFMGWYSQGTQVVDYIEHEDGSFEWKEAGWWVPDGSTAWASHIFAFDKNEDGTYTYWGASADISRTAVDIFNVTLPAPAQEQEVALPEPLPRRAFDNVRRGGSAGWLVLVLVAFGLRRRHKA